MNLVIIGAQASGKMTIGQEVAKLTGMTLFHNHDSIDFSLRFIPEFSEDMFDLNTRITFAVYDVFARSGRPLIGTALINFKNLIEVQFLTTVQTIFHYHGQEILFVELETALEERLRRNRTENRLTHKPLKRHIEVSEAEILSTADTCQYTSLGIPEGIQHYLKINNTHLTANEVAQLIIKKMEELEQKQTK
ncbi:TPA: shikimate kinase [Streptococcus suis]|uniref:Shikimate kinase n=1 Tax=Streptococcus suis TaxID=1307 RepID=A0A142UN11_STRSU|nr:hypothetical protein [Streptococcus suis]AEB80946.1 conserved hypothetical protein [Streptococcus suis ST3]AER16722.1 conserved hypothetical protein [Streptococcus suis D9]AGW86848.1 hypothetical protein YB51_2380 [Streptococcus suis YB51]AHF58914.1 hypothetical protein HAS68_0580 [Streptococcus suis 05HAS68]ALA28307.1 shikimate kinase [Streptococcus suis]